MLQTSYPQRVFSGVHFVLFGFNPITESKVRFKLVNGGGVDMGQYCGSCTHVIVDQIAYDDPVCVAARKDRKTLVTALWVDHSADIGMPVDAASVMYRPLKDLNGIPGAKSLIVCLTGYLRQDRDDIMTMVGLMGAQFSKPLVANKVTHLVCYKFEGEKYELAKRLGTIKLVNHRWLEDCLKDWALLPADNYNKSGFELEMIGAEAKDSEEEAEDSKLGQLEGRNINKSPHSTKFGVATTHGLSKPVMEPPNAPDSTGPQVSPKDNKVKDSSSIPGNKNRSDQGSSIPSVYDQKKSCLAPDVSRGATPCKLPNSANTYVKTSESNDADFPKELGCPDLGINGNTNSSGRLTDLQANTSEPKKLVSDLRSTSASAEGVGHSDVKFRAVSNSRKNQRGFILPRSLDGSLGNATGPSVSPSDGLEFRNNLETSSTEVEKGREGILSTCDEGLGGEPISILPQKRANGASSAKLKSRRQSADAKLSIEKFPSANGESQGLTMMSMVDEPPEAEGYFSAGEKVLKKLDTSSISKSGASTSNLLAFDEPFSRNASSESAQCGNACQNSALTDMQSLNESKMNGKPVSAGNVMGQVDGDEAEQQNATKNLKCSSPGNNVKKSQIEGSAGLNNLDLKNEESNKLIRKSPRKKSMAKKSLGSKPKVGATAKQKRSGSLKETTLQGESGSLSSGSKELATCDSRKLQSSPQILDVSKSMEQETGCKEAEPELMDDETEAPDDRCSYDFGMLLDENKSELVHVSKKEDTTKDKSGAGNHRTSCEEAMPPNKDTNGTDKNKQSQPVDSTKKLKAKHQGKRPAGRTKKTTVTEELATLDARKLQSSPQILDVSKSMEQETIHEDAEPELMDDETEAPDDKCSYGFGRLLDENKSELVHVSKKEDTAKAKSGAGNHRTCEEEAMPPNNGTNGTEKKKQSSLVDSNKKLKVKHQGKRPTGRTKKTTVTKELLKSEEAVSGEKILSERKHEAEVESNGEISPPADTSNKSTAPRNKSNDLIEEKENRPIDGEQDIGEDKTVGNATIKSSARPAKTNSKKMGLNTSVSEIFRKGKTEATCFILSGHRLQRKEFQQVIKRLKGRVCRDSHQWSYQATHFIVPDPIRRTEKFFAAVASGRWILKTDFLTDSSQAGKFLPEEPYEWHKNGLSEDGAINMEAPRKWRLLKERTGHGAFYGMRIVLYGDFIAPPLDTLKRVVKAGDGTIVATSPPYTRFLGTGIDYAIVSPGIPRVDSWVQEFLKHEIPCVVPDYLVEYVCKPGFSLDRHVLYGTHAWAEKSFAKLQTKAEEITEELIPPKDCDDDEDDIMCQVCGSRDRGDVMMICGDESGSVGCGVGTHIDCCDPPLTGIPEDDWFCQKCSRTRDCSSSPRKRIKTVSSKRK